ncbi:MAG: hypothetical protein MZV64_58965 [Ignavibacteriales bacterium]|nr:hypothetical protein [Ignavibacteriales bacterium]
MGGMTDRTVRIIVQNEASDLMWADDAAQAAESVQRLAEGEEIQKKKPGAFGLDVCSVRLCGVVRVAVAVHAAGVWHFAGYRVLSFAGHAWFRYVAPCATTQPPKRDLLTLMM